MTTIIPYFDPILGKLRNSDLGLISLVSVTDPFIINNLKVNSTASINLLDVNTANFINLSAKSTASFSTIHGNNAYLSNATIGNMGLTNLQWDLVNGNGTAEGQMSWDSVNQTVTLGMAGGNVDVALGLETLFPKRVKNSTATTMPKGSVVYINGVSGNDPTVTFAIATSDMTSAYTLGFTSEDITAGQKGWVTTFGELTGLNLSSYTGGDTLYLSGATAGLYTKVKPKAPNHYVRLGTVVKATADGVLVVNVINGFETDELHDVVLTSLASGNILISNGSLWNNTAIGTLGLLNDLPFASLISRPSLGTLSTLNELSFYSLISRPSLGTLSTLNELSFFSLISRPSLGTLSTLNELSFFSLISRPSLGTLSTLNTLVHGSTTSLLLDDHTQYVLLAGRTSGQTVNGGNASGNSLTLDSTSNANKGNILLNPTGGRIGIGRASTVLSTLHINSTQNAIVFEKSTASTGQIGTFIYAQQNGQTTVGDTNTELGIVVAGVGSFSSGDPAIYMYGNAYTRIPQQRGTLVFQGGLVSGATGNEGDIVFRTDSGFTSVFTKDRKFGLRTDTPTDIVDLDLGFVPVNQGLTLKGQSTSFGDFGLKIINSGANGETWYIDSTADGSGFGSGKLVFNAGVATAKQVLTLTNSETVGINNPNPTTTLDVNGFGRFASGAVIGSPTYGTIAGGLLFQRSSANPFILFQQDSSTTSGGQIRGLASGGLAFTNQAGNQERVRINQDGNVGIGVSTPQSVLDVISPLNGYISAGRRVSLASGQFTGIHFGYLEETNTQYRKSALVFERIDGAARGKIHLLNNNDATSASAGLADSKITIKADGDIGISERDPLARLHIVTPQNAIVLEKSLASTTALGPFLYSQQNGQISAGATDSEFGFLVAGVGSTNTNQGPAFLMRGNLFSRTANQRGLVSFSAGNISNPSGLDGAIEFNAYTTLRISTGSALTESLRVNSNGAVVLRGGETLANGVGISFPSTQSASTNANTLDDYEEGTFTPTFTAAAGTFGNITYDGARQGRYTKIGNAVHINGVIITDSITVSTASGVLFISGLPFTVQNTSGFWQTGTLGYAFGYAGEEPSEMLFEPNTTRIRLYYRTTADGNSTNSVVADLGTGANANETYFGGTYFV